MHLSIAVISYLCGKTHPTIIPMIRVVSTLFLFLPPILVFWGHGSPAPLVTEPGGNGLRRVPYGVTSDTARDENRSLFRAASELPFSLSSLPWCPYIARRRLWSWRKRGMWMRLKVHPCKRGCPGLVRLLPIPLHHQL